MNKMPSPTIVVAVLALSQALLFGGQDKVAPDLRDLGPTATKDVLVNLNVDPDTSAVIARYLNNGKVKYKYQKSKVALLTATGNDVKTLSDDPDVDYVSPNREVTASLDYAAAATFANVAWSSNWTGAGIQIVVIDSGIDSAASDLQGRIMGVSNFAPGLTDAKDQYGHGTHVAGILAGSGKESTGAGFKATFKGIAPGAGLNIFRVLDAAGKGTDSAVIDAIEKVIQKNADNAAKGKPRAFHIINLSLGRPAFESAARDPLCRAVEAAWKSGVVVVVAAGNYGRENSVGNHGYGTITSPGNHPMVITVGAMNTVKTATRADDVMASYSSKGPTTMDHVVKPDLVAPGNLISSVGYRDSRLQKTYPNNRVQDSDFKVGGGTGRTDKYVRLSGTSMATPMVSGAAALLLQKRPDLTPDQVKAILMATAQKAFPSSSVATDPATNKSFTIQYDIFTVGAGYLDISAALSSGDIPPVGRIAISPVAAYNESTGEVVLLTDYSQWATNALWGTSALWGTNALWGSNAVWGTNAVWGSNALWGSNAVWGTNAVWGSTMVAGTNAVWGSSAIWGSGGTEAFNALWGSNAVWGSNALWGTQTVEAASSLVNGDR